MGQPPCSSIALPTALPPWPACITAEPLPRRRYAGLWNCNPSAAMPPAASPCRIAVPRPPASFPGAAASRNTPARAAPSRRAQIAQPLGLGQVPQLGAAEGQCSKSLRPVRSRVQAGLQQGPRQLQVGLPAARQTACQDWHSGELLQSLVEVQLPGRIASGWGQRHA